MKRLAIAALIVATPAFALDGTRSPANVPPIIGIAPGNSPDAVRQFQRGAADLLVQANPGATSSLKDQLVGAWALVACESGGALLPYCAGPNAITILDASGHYATIFAGRGRPKYDVKEPYRFNLSAEQIKSVTDGFVANFGTWSVNEADKKISYHIDGALFPNVEGTNFDVTVSSVSEGELKLKGPLGQDVWRQLKK